MTEWSYLTQYPLERYPVRHLAVLFVWVLIPRVVTVGVPRHLSLRFSPSGPGHDSVAG